jgi:putative peptidoglycan binding protein
MQRISSTRIGYLMLISVLVGAVLVAATSAQEAKSSRSPGKAPSAQHVREVQEALVKAGYDPGPIDGIFGPRTKAALRKYLAVPPPQVPSPADQVIMRFRTERRESP